MKRMKMLCVLAFAMSVTGAYAADQICSRPVEVPVGDKEWELAQTHKSGLWYIEQNSRTCDVNGNDCKPWRSTPDMHAEYVHLDPSGAVYRFPFSEAHIVSERVDAQGRTLIQYASIDHLEVSKDKGVFSTAIEGRRVVHDGEIVKGTEKKGDKRKIAKLGNQLVKNLEFSSGGEGIHPRQDYRMNVWKTKSAGDAKIHVAPDLSQACILF